MKADRDGEPLGLSSGSRHHAAQPARRGVCRPPHRHADDAGMADAARRDRPGRDPAPGGAARTGGRDRHRQGRDHRRKPGLAALRSAGRARRQRYGAGAIGASARNGLSCASPAGTATSTSPPSIRNSTPGNGLRRSRLPELIVPFKRQLYIDILAEFQRALRARWPNRAASRAIAASIAAARGIAV